MESVDSQGKIIHVLRNAPDRGLYLKEIAERAKLNGGSTKVSSARGTGTQIEVTIPIGKGKE